MMRSLYVELGLGVVLVIVAALFFLVLPTREAIVTNTSPAVRPAGTSTKPANVLLEDTDSQLTPVSNPESQRLIEVQFVGPRENIPLDAPKAYGFWSFAMPVPGALSRSGQPLMSEFEWLAKQGWKSVVNLRVDGERGEIGDDAELAGFNDLGFNYLHLLLTDGHPPTDEQAEEFLLFTTNPDNQPAHVHCRGGIGRAGTMIALYRYAVQGWPLGEAIEESRLFKGGISFPQEEWLKQWAQKHGVGSYGY